jgi:NAD-specific glutamate dehydrogenase
MFKAMSADHDNLISLCATHHQGGVWMKSSSGFNFHNSPRESTEWLMENMPERYKELKGRSMIKVHLDYQFWEKKHAELKEQRDFLCKENEFVKSQWRISQTKFQEGINRLKTKTDKFLY